MESKIMSFKINLITVSILVAISGPSFAANFGVNNANTNNVNSSNYECNRCVENSAYSGKLDVALGYNDIDDIHAGNALGTSEDGAIGSVSSDILFQNKSGYQAQLIAHQLGFDNSFASLQIGDSGLYELVLDYASIKTIKAGDVNSQLWHNDGMLTPSADVNTFNLALEREKLGVGVVYKNDEYNSFVSYNQEDKTGHRSSSIVTPSPINIGLPVNATTSQWDAGIGLNGDNWTTDLSYSGSIYNNKISDLSLPYLNDVYAAAPDSQAHQISLSGNYRIDQTVMSGRVATGRMIQDEKLIQMSGNPLQSWDGQVDTIDGRFAVTSMLSNRLRLGGKIDYNKRDNKSSTAEFAQYNFNSLTGAFRQNTPLDYERNNYGVNASYRIASGYRLQAGYDSKEITRNYSEREQTQDDTLWVKLNIRKFEMFNINLKSEYANRDGSKFESDILTASEENALLRKYYLADRTRNAYELKLSHTPNDWMSVDVTSRYAKDEYKHTEVGLLDSEDYGYDANISIQISKNVDTYGFIGQQWINSSQAGSQVSNSYWYTDVEDEFINVGAGFNYRGLMQDKLTIGMDYLFANSTSNTNVNVDNSLPYGDYYSYNHSASVHADYALNPQMALKLSYRYERYYDTDAASVEIASIPGLITLQDINHDYNAHQVMLSFSYKLH
jgi:MtrB/PioB family decaheme-associated outer membrane protein